MISGTFEVRLDDLDEIAEAIAVRVAAWVVALLGVDPHAGADFPHLPVSRTSARTG